MSSTYDPHHARYPDEADVRDELTRVFDVCHSCQRCLTLCTTFPTLFDLIDRPERRADADRDADGERGDVGGRDERPASGGARSAGDLTPVEQDRVVDLCFQCKLCAVGCPYHTDRHEWAVDVPELIVRARAMRHATGQVPLRERWANQVLARTDLVGAVGSASASLANRVVAARAGSPARRVLAKLTGISPVRTLPNFAHRRFSEWFERRWQAAAEQEGSHGAPARRGTVTVYPTCVVEFQAPAIGHDLVKVYERNGFGCRVSAARCCGAPWLHAGDVARFAAVARENVGALAREIRDGNDVVVAQPTCSLVLKQDYPTHVGGPEARLVADHTYDAAEYLMRAHRRGGPDGGLDTDFAGEVPTVVTYHAPCHLRAQDAGAASRELLELTGATVSVVEQCSGVDGTWGLRAGHEEIPVGFAARLGEQIEQVGARTGADVVAGDCHLANTAIAEQTGRTPVHPLQVVARAYGIPSER